MQKIWGVSKAEKQGSDIEEKNNKAGDKMAEPFVLEVKQRNKKIRMEFASEEDRRYWERAYRKRRFYTLYFMVGVGINFLLYFAGLDLSRNILMGGIVGLAVPLASMFGLTELHSYLASKNRKG